jgi:hypothetical protein
MKMAFNLQNTVEHFIIHQLTGVNLTTVQGKRACLPKRMDRQKCSKNERQNYEEQERPSRNN